MGDHILHVKCSSFRSSGFFHAEFRYRSRVFLVQLFYNNGPRNCAATHTKLQSPAHSSAHIPINSKRTSLHELLAIYNLWGHLLIRYVLLGEGGNASD